MISRGGSLTYPVASMAVLEVRHCILPLALALAGLAPACKRAPSMPASPSGPAVPAWFEDITARSGLDFVHDSGATGDYFMPESIGSGGAMLDFDNDGRLDLYLVHHASPESKSRNRLYHQGNDGRFRDVSDGSGLDVTGYGMGVAVGDLNNDGLVDLLLTEYGRIRLFLNLGQGKFQDHTHVAGLENTRWGTSAAFFDYDRDGWLDLVLVNYVDYSPSQKCYDTRGLIEYCGPQGMQGSATRLYHNQGAQPGTGLRFEDVTVSSLIATKTGSSLGVFCADFDGDRWPDIFITDDGQPNRLFINQRNGTFREEAALRGLAYNALGGTAANMGIAFGDVDGDGLFDLFVTHLVWEQHTLWQQGPRGLFQDQSGRRGLAHLGMSGTAFGTVMADFNQDGAPDLAWVNGLIKRGDDPGPYLPGMNPFWNAYAQRPQLLMNEGSGHFRDISAANPAFCGQAAVGRGLACGDLDNDGAPDLLAVNTGAPARLYRNACPGRGHWLTIRAVDPAWGGRDAHGAEVTVEAGARRWWRLVQPGYSFLVSNDPRAHFGLGAAATVDRVRVLWPDGVEEVFPGGAADRFVILQKGTGGKP
jgi:enediyne biosynthesis protein E4